MSAHVLGLSWGYHDSAAALLREGELISAVQEERFTRRKQDAGFPEHALRACLGEAGIGVDQLDHIFYYEDPLPKLGRITQSYLNFGWRGWRSFATEYPAWLVERPFVRRRLRRDLRRLFGPKVRVPPIDYVPHHRSHAASAFYAGPFPEAAVLCIDGVGEWATTSAWIGSEARLTPLWEVRFPHSLGLLYSAFTSYCGFKVDSGEYKLMGLAPYGRPSFYQTILDHLIELKADGSFWLDMGYFDYAVGDRMINERFEALFGGPARTPEGPVTQRELDLAASVQKVLEESIVRLGTTLRHETGHRRLCMAGGVGLNCVANGRLLGAGIFDDIWVQPAAGDAGGAVGAALAGWHERMGRPRRARSGDLMKGAYLGPAYPDQEIEAALRAHQAVFERLDEERLVERTASVLAEGHVVGWFQGRMEFGPRALGARSILGDARDPAMQRTMNLKIKFRESFRPFAPAVLEEHAGEWFELDRPSPFMMFVVNVHERRRVPHDGDGLSGLQLLQVARSTIPAVTHVDYSARVQTVGAATHPRFRALMERFQARTGCPALINTSFNVRGEPIVESPAHAYACFMRTGMDYLAIGSFFLAKAAQPPYTGPSGPLDLD